MYIPSSSHLVTHLLAVANTLLYPLAALLSTMSHSKSRASHASYSPSTVLDLKRPTIEHEWWSITENRWNELRAEAVGSNKTKAQTASTTLRKYHDVNAIMLSDIGKPTPAGCCKSCWDRKTNQPKRTCRVFAAHEDGQSLACAYCRLKGIGGCNANVIPQDEEVSPSTALSAQGYLSSE